MRKNPDNSHSQNYNTTFLVSSGWLVVCPWDTHFTESESWSLQQQSPNTEMCLGLLGCLHSLLTRNHQDHWQEKTCTHCWWLGHRLREGHPGGNDWFLGWGGSFSRVYRWPVNQDRCICGGVIRKQVSTDKGSSAGVRRDKKQEQGERAEEGCDRPLTPALNTGILGIPQTVEFNRTSSVIHGRVEQSSTVTAGHTFKRQKESFWPPSWNIGKTSSLKCSWFGVCPYQVLLSHWKKYKVAICLCFPETSRLLSLHIIFSSWSRTFINQRLVIRGMIIVL